MKSTFKRPVPIPAIVILTIGLITATITFMTQGQDLSDTPNQTSPTQVQTVPTSPETPTVSPLPAPSPPASTQSPQPSQPSPNPMESDRVDVEDVYPEYCRVYFPSRGTVSLFDYRERMYRCLYGVDRSVFDSERKFINVSTKAVVVRSLGTQL